MGTAVGLSCRLFILTFSRRIPAGWVVIYMNNKINPITIMINRAIEIASSKISFFILILQMDYDIFSGGEVSLPVPYWMLSIIILMTAMRVPISKAS